jgi:Flp pilus assembly protein TadD/nitrate/TMAO reductase-like tetraheme cytochrome c subunit
MLRFGRSSPHCLLAALALFLCACGDSSDTAEAPERELSTREKNAQVFPYSHNPQRLAKFGPDSCVNCHEKAVNDWKKSHHAKANRPVSVAKDAPAFTPTREIEESGVTYQMVRVDDAFKLRVIAADESVEEYDLVGVIGETPIRQYLAHLPGNKLQTISATYDVLNDRWVDVFAGQDRMPGEWGHWLGQGMNWNANCAYCHTTEYEKGFDYEGNLYQSTWIQQGLACAECHSGLEEHVTASLAGDYEAGLLALDREQTEHNCVTCHSRRDQLTADAFELGDAYHDHFSLSLPDQPGLYYPDGQILDEVFVHASFEMSRMNHAGVSCMDCHNPHTLEHILPVENNMLCMRCHDGGVMDSPIIEPLAHSFHPAGSTGNLCVECHMSETVYMQEDWRADHGFHSPDPLMTKELGIPNACNKCHTEESVDWAVEHAEAWYGEKLANSRQRQRARAISKAYDYESAALPELLALAAEEDIPAWQATYAGLIANYLPHAGAEAHLRSLLDHESPLVRERAVSGLARTENGGDALIAKLSDESRSVRIAASRGLAARNEDVADPRAAKEWAEYLGFNADRPQSLFMLANQAARESRPEEVLDRVQRAIALDTLNPEMYHQSAILLSSAGLNKDARKQLFAGWELAPQEPRFPYSLGLLAAETGDLQTAVGYLEETVAMAPDFYRAWHNLSLAYQQLNRPEDAQRARLKARGE